ncbi:MAG: OsmC family protein [Bacteroidales bacterium]|nr:OsmC family protein [Bacteroidales bacterium]
MPNPAELLLTSLAACLLKNIERYSEILHISYRKAEIEIEAIRTDSPPQIIEIKYYLRIATDETERKINTLHKNILKFGTISNTLAKTCKLDGTLQIIDYENDR